MKKVMIVLLLMFSSTNTMALGPNLPHPYDYGLHAAGGYIISDVMQRRGYSKLQVLAVVAAVAVAKEASDKHFDWNDAAAWIPGPIIQFSIQLD